MPWWAMPCQLSAIQGLVRCWASACCYDRKYDLIGPARAATDQDSFIAGLVLVAVIVRAIWLVQRVPLPVSKCAITKRISMQLRK